MWLSVVHARLICLHAQLPTVSPGIHFSRRSPLSALPITPLAPPPSLPALERVESVIPTVGSRRYLDFSLDFDIPQLEGDEMGDEKAEVTTRELNNRGSTDREWEVSLRCVDPVLPALPTRTHFDLINERLTPEQVAQHQLTLHDIEVLSLWDTASGRGQENVDPNLPQCLPSAPGRSSSTSTSASTDGPQLRKNPTRRTASKQAASRGIDLLFGLGPDLVPSSIDESDCADAAEEKRPPAPFAGESAARTGDEEDQSGVPGPSAVSGPLQPIVRSAALGHAHRVRQQMESLVYPGCHLTTEDVVASIAITTVCSMHCPCRTCAAMRPACADVSWCVCVQTKHKVSRRCTETLCKIIREILPEGHQFPRNIWRALRLTGWRLTHLEVEYCAQGLVPSRSNEPERECPEPMVYYGPCSQRPNCWTCGHQEKKVMYLIPISSHIEVRSTPTHTPPCSSHEQLMYSLCTLCTPHPALSCAVLHAAAFGVGFMETAGSSPRPGAVL
jgi:hypothetical protein